jgi:hypothetical protein
MKYLAKALNEIYAAMGEEITVQAIDKWVNNETLEGLAIQFDGKSAAPVVYPEEEWKEMTHDELAEMLMRRYRPMAKDIEPGSIINRDNILRNVRPRLVSNKNINEIERKGYVHAPFLDMEIIIYITLPEISTKDYLASTPLRKEMLQMFEVEEKEIIRQAIQNINTKSESVVEDMKKKLIKMGLPEKDASQISDWILIVTNTSGGYGAATILDRNTRTIIHEKLGEKVVILPSSVHEVIVLPYVTQPFQTEDEMIRDCKNMVEEVNATQVKERDRLTDSVYIMDKGLITLATD